MVRCAALLIGVAGAAMLAGAGRGEAQDASFGCKVLLCAAAKTGDDSAHLSPASNRSPRDGRARLSPERWRWLARCFHLVSSRHSTCTYMLYT